MIIGSKDSNCFIKIEFETDGEGYSGFRIEAHVDIGHGKFDATNVDVQLLNLTDFTAELEKVINGDANKACLEGTYESFFAFHTEGSQTKLNFQLGDTLCGESGADFHLSGEFEVNRDDLARFHSGFKDLAEKAGSVSANE
ncbi:MAG: hypothetical protein R2684_08530 [Pyrinomonadaceae bacterium]